MGAKGVLSAPAASATSDHDFIPADMAELAKHYYDYIRGMVRKAGIPDQDAEDSVQYILQQLGIAPSVIDQYKPDHLTEHQGELKKTRFSTFLGAKVLLYCRGERGRVQRRASHEVQILDAPSGEGTGLSEMFGSLGAAWDDYSGPEAEEFIARTRGFLAAVPPRSSRDTCDLVALFDELVAEITTTGGFTYAGIEARFGISGTTAGAWLARLRKVLGRELGRPSVTIGGVALTRDEVASALEILRAAAGIMVKQPLAKAGHPLSEAADRWYHPFSAEEIKKFPDLKIDPGTHRKPAGQVKLAVMHRLERILAEADVPAAAPAAVVSVPPPAVPAEPEPVSARELVEAELWRVHGIDPDDVDRILSTVERVYAVAS